MQVYASILDLIGNTPVVQLQRLPDLGGARVYGKLEVFNPGGSVKDRAAWNMIRSAESEGKISPGKSVLVEPTSGNTGIGLAMVCAARGYRCIITMPDNASAERVSLLQAYGAEVHLTPAALRMQGAIDKARELLVQVADGFMPMQFENPANPEAHRETTALEIYNDFDGQLDALFLTAGTGGTVTGTGEILKQKIADLKIFVVEPAGSPVLSGGLPGPHRIPGTGPGFVPKVLNTQVYDGVLQIQDDDAESMVRRLAAEEGILVGPSGAAAAHFALLAAREMPPTKRVLFLAPDSGERYLSSGIFRR
ncbi:cysteine synthase A [Alicyclobacillaceae bacterium I2511]|nr:cysteine synthase A [Alicyclobacillaceae bacterium I2511]